MEYISVGRRALAIIVDTVILVPLAIVIIVVTGDVESTSEPGTMSFEARAGGLSTVLVVLLWFGYFTILEKTAGATLGKRLVGIRVVMQGGAPLTWGASVIRNLLRVVDGFFFYLVAAILVWNSQQRQRLGDMAANTFVVDARSVGVASVVQAPASPTSMPPASPPPPQPPPPPS
jgi:uncharacterized RDD family membrane protein YckC